ncbi:MAG: peptidoglycan DD-metalloendopeptidase family protein [Oscillospiraceae bacterium]|jgi:murein DD-endopeptidase MepM/ murein hydrolase activator NlpD|nr:peptidoglycan DD-metalloendopeptidase family protein [Oscillospiraceae bacterium]
MMKKIGKKMAELPLLFLQRLGEAAVIAFLYIVRNFWEFLGLFAKFLWDKSVKLRFKALAVFQYIGVFVASPFVKLWMSFCRMLRDIKKGKRKKGLFGALGAFFINFGRFVFGKQGLAVTAFNYAAPIISVVFLFNVVTDATSATYALKLTVNGKFLGYVENEQVFLDAEALVRQRVNYFESDKVIEVLPEFSVERIETSEKLTEFQVANAILRISDFNLEQAYGFYIDGVFYGAVMDNSEIDRTLKRLLNVYRSDNPDEEVSFINDIEWEKQDLYLAESIVDPRDIIKMITVTKEEAAYYTVESGDSHLLICDILDMTMEEVERLNPGFSEKGLYVGDQIRKNVEVPYLPVSISRTEEYEQTVPFETEYRNDSTLYVGSTNTTQKGADGVNHVVARVAYVNGVEISRTPTRITTVSAPVTKIVYNGTKPMPTGHVKIADAEYGKFIWPLNGGRITCNYGWDSSWGRSHTGIDIAGVGYGAPIFAGGSGTVILSRSGYYGYGDTIIIQHDSGLRTLYAHCSVRYVGEGEYVTQGQQIANVGSTGYSTGPHLHFEVRQGNAILNPNLYLPR